MIVRRNQWSGHWLREAQVILPCTSCHPVPEPTRKNNLQAKGRGD